MTCEHHSYVATTITHWVHTCQLCGKIFGWTTDEIEFCSYINQARNRVIQPHPFTGCKTSTDWGDVVFFFFLPQIFFSRKWFTARKCRKLVYYFVVIPWDSTQFYIVYSLNFSHLGTTTRYFFPAAFLHFLLYSTELGSCWYRPIHNFMLLNNLRKKLYGSHFVQL